MAVALRRGVTWLVVAAVAGLGVAAAVDALVAREEPGPQAARQTTAPLLARQPELAVSRLREAGVSGVLTFSDEECRLHAVSLPELEPRRAPRIEICEALTQSGGLGVVDGEVVWAGLGLRVVQTVLSREELGRAVRTGLGIRADEVAAGFRAVRAVSLDDERYVVLADSTYEPRERVVSVFEGERALVVHPRWVVRDAGALRASPGGGFFALFGGEAEGVQLFDQRGGVLPVPVFARDSHAIAWSPDDRWTALATDESVYVFPTRRSDELVVRIPLAVRDLDWAE